MKLRNLARSVLSFAAAAGYVCSQAGCSKQEEPKPPENSTYYTGKMLEKPKGSMVPAAPSPGRSDGSQSK